jgi:tetratricopeptide (TPR) repeat protein
VCLEQQQARRSTLAVTALVLAISASTALAREPLYGALDHADLLRCEDLFWHGHAAEARSCYHLLETASTPIAIRAEASWALGDLQGANSLFQEAVKAEPKNALLRVRWGELYLQTYQYNEADTLFDEALAIDGKNPWAKIGSAEALSKGGGDSATINKLMTDVVENDFTPAGVRYRGLLMLLHNALGKDQFEQADKVIKDARAAAESGKLPQLELYALEAANAFMTFKPYQAFIDQALHEDPAYGDAWAIPGRFAMMTRRYRESGAFYEKAVLVQPDHWQAHLELGQNYMRLNQISAGVDHIHTSFDGDKFNPTTINLMRMLEVFLNQTEAFSFPNPPEGPFPKLSLRLNKSESTVLKDYVRELAEAGMATYQKRYRFTPTEPVVIEVYPNHEDFVVRSVGMPGVGLLGVTFGYLLAMDSPTAHARSESYHWGTTLWHELAHVYTVEASSHLVPRWYTEGISVFEEWRTGPIPGRKIPLDVYKAMAEGKFLPVEKLDDGFMRPTYENQVIVSYMQGGLIIDFINSEFGFDKIVDMLELFGKGVKLKDAVQQSLGISVDVFDKQFKQYIDIEYGKLLKNLPGWQADRKTAFAALEKEDWQGAVDAAKRAVFAFPDYVEADSAYIALARGYSRLNDKDNEFRTLETFWQKGGYASRALLALGNDYIERNDTEHAFKVFKDVVWADPFSQELHSKLGDLYMTHKEAAKALREYLVLLSLNPPDQADANYKVATAYQAMNDKVKTMQYVMTALDVAPQYRPAQSLLLELSRSTTGKQ